MNLPADKSIEKAVARRRSAETARKARIFNTRLRVMGIDTNALSKQVEDKKQRQNMEMQCDKAFDKLRLHHNDLLLQQETDERRERAALHTNLVQYWATHQRSEDSRDADLKCDLKGAVRITVPEGHLGPASMQIYQGDTNTKEQKKREQMKTERVLQAQIQDNERRRSGEKHREMLVSKELVQQDFRRLQLHAQEEERKKATLRAVSNYNEALAAEQVETLKEQRRREERENRAEMLHTLTSDMMTETPEAAHLGLEGRGPCRVPVDRWKGMSTEQLSIIQKERKEQQLKTQRQRDAEKAQEAAWHLHILKLSRTADEEQKKVSELRRNLRIQTDLHNFHLAGVQRARQDYLNKELYTNRPTKDYFCQFNTTSR
ncbi:RIB43A-like with coiled-coils protein 1 isoform X1 [Takifugu flavidus]|uniref:RIB43A-like with coiled-coils protein 1 n=2 Tax=Takifugu flavidus TaxID=433684 RepID=A0A5C6MTA0_9TELE|nr:RIB43A-like with coiled-coils protein 1 isoform X1 [Takifugu flavidus]XP_056895586.1 RIB43A-like with coiled-coils protein 1 isoform X1 [Takifugu flavidus]TWW56627.1 hypothetical protein D4764_08G0006140 [Takifugu flavidus]